METAKEKAKQLYNKFYEASDGMGIAKYQSKVELAKKSALIAVDEILLEQCKSSELKDAKYQLERIDYWMQVKTELLNL